MPLPSKKKDESKEDFISRCMSNSQAKKDFPDQKQRSAVCFSRASRPQPVFTNHELEALATSLPIGNRAKPVSLEETKKRKKFKRKKDKFRKVRDEEVGSSVKSSLLGEQRPPKMKFGVGDGFEHCHSVSLS